MDVDSVNILLYCNTWLNEVNFSYKETRLLRKEDQAILDIQLKEEFGSLKGWRGLTG